MACRFCLSPSGGTDRFKNLRFALRGSTRRFLRSPHHTMTALVTTREIGINRRKDSYRATVAAPAAITTMSFAARQGRAAYQLTFDLNPDDRARAYTRAPVVRRKPAAI